MHTEPPFPSKLIQVYAATLSFDLILVREARKSLTGFHDTGPTQEHSHGLCVTVYMCFLGFGVLF